jgi:hypothetical protein
MQGRSLMNGQKCQDAMVKSTMISHKAWINKKFRAEVPMEQAHCASSATRPFVRFC